VLHPEASIVAVFGMSDQIGKSRVSGKAATIGTVGSTQPEEFTNRMSNFSEHDECQGVTHATRRATAANLKS
jgi:hypothetical protein